MRSTRPRGFRSEGQYDEARVRDDLQVNLYEDGLIAHQIDADRVLVGGGLPDEAVRLEPAFGDAAAHLSRGAEPVDACVKHDGGETVVWLAP